MPCYTFFNEKTKEYKDIIMSINDIHEYIDETGYKWIREFSVPNAAIDSNIDPMSATDFANKTNKKSGNLGDLFDQSKEAAMKRKEKLGYDPVKQKYLEDWSKKRKGKVPPPSMTQD